MVALGTGVQTCALPAWRIPHAGSWDAVPQVRSFARLSAPGVFVSTITRPAMYADYLAEQIDLLVQDYGVKVEVGKSAQQMPFPYVLEGLDMSALDGIAPNELARSEEHKSELQSLMRISYAVFCLKKKKQQ